MVNADHVLRSLAAYCAGLASPIQVYVSDAGKDVKGQTEWVYLSRVQIAEVPGVVGTQVFDYQISYFCKASVPSMKVVPGVLRTSRESVEHGLQRKLASALSRGTLIPLYEYAVDATGAPLPGVAQNINIEVKGNVLGQTLTGPAPAGGTLTVRV